MAGLPPTGILASAGLPLAIGAVAVLLGAGVRRRLCRLRVRRRVRGRIAADLRRDGRGAGVTVFRLSGAGPHLPTRPDGGLTEGSGSRPAPAGVSLALAPAASRASVLVPGLALVAGAVGRRFRRWARRPPDLQLDQRVGFGVLVGVGVLPVSGVPLAALVGAAVWAVPGARRRSATRLHRAAVIDDLPDVIDLIRLAVESGLNVSGALAVVADQGPDAGPVVAALRHTRRRVELGETLVSALGAVETLGEPARPLHEAVVATHRHGVPLSPALARAAAEARDVRRRAREEAARRLPVHLLFPLVFCTLPALLVLTVVPLLLRSFPSLGP